MKFTDQFGKNYEFDEKNIEITWRISVYGVLFGEDRKLLMMMPHFSDKWQFSGGQIELEETTSEALKREYLEEVGYKVEPDLSKLLYFRENYFYDSYLKKHFHSIQLTFEVHLTDPKRYEEFIERGEGMDYGEAKWISLSSLTEDMVQHTHWPIVQLLQEKEL